MLKSKGDKKVTGTAHHMVPQYMKEFLGARDALLLAWNENTMLARNEWVCYVTEAKKEETRAKRLEKMKVYLLSGRKRPCCFAGCPHRK